MNATKYPMTTKQVDDAQTETSSSPAARAVPLLTAEMATLILLDRLGGEPLDPPRDVVLALRAIASGAARVVPSRPAEMSCSFKCCRCGDVLLHHCLTCAAPAAAEEQPKPVRGEVGGA